MAGRRIALLLVPAVIIVCAALSACGGGGSSSSAPVKQVVADGGHQAGYVFKSATGKGGPQETAEVKAYVAETLGGGATGECASLPFEDPPGFDLFDCSFRSAGKSFGSFYAVAVETGKISELGLRGDPDPDGSPEYKHPIPGVE